jgi:hypothetical protein
MRTVGWIAVAACGLTTALLVAREAAQAERAGSSSAAFTASAVAHQEAEIVQFAGGTLRVDFNPLDFEVSRRDLIAWVRDSARATTAYFGRFPVPYAHLVFEPTGGAEVAMGRAVGRPQPKIVVTMGQRTKGSQLAQESLLVHEMTHLAIPDHDIRHLWLHEGIATYVEYVARAQAGLVTPVEMWTELMRELPAGLPERREAGGLDGTPSDGRRYWGGALFCLLADIEIRKATSNRLGLQDALRALQRQGGNLSRLWTLERTLDVADRGTGTMALSQLYRLMGNRPHTPDLNRLWRDMGLYRERGGLVLDEMAPLAAVRRAITDRPSAPLLVAEPRLLRIVDAGVRERRR